MEMYCNVFKQILRTELFPIVKAEIEYDITVNETGIILEMNGRNEKLSVSIVSKYVLKFQI